MELKSKLKYYIPSPDMTSKIFAAILITILFAHYASASPHQWQLSSSVSCGLPAIMGIDGRNAKPETFIANGSLYAVVSYRDIDTLTHIIGYRWSGACWVVNTSITNGLTPYSEYTSFRAYNNTSINRLEMYKGSSSWQSYAWIWNGTAWNSNNNLISVGFGIDGLCQLDCYISNTMSVFNFLLNNSKIMVIGDDIYHLRQLEFDGSEWNYNASVAFLGAPQIALPDVFNFSNTLKIVSGSSTTNGLIYYSYNGSSWNPDNFASGLETAIHASPTVFNLGSDYYMLIGEGMGTVKGYVLTTPGLLSSTISPKAIFKCQSTNIFANLTGFVDTIISVTAWVNSTQQVVTTGGIYQSTQIPYAMVNQGGGVWLYQYGNDANLLYGNRTVSFTVTTSVGDYYYPAVSMFTVYSDVCTGTNINNWSQIPNQGLGHYSSRIWQSGGNVLDFALMPWIEYWGYVFYLIIIFAVCLITYMKSQRIIEPILIAFVSLGILATTMLPIIPDDFKQYIVMLLGIAVGSLLYKIFKG